MGATSQKRIAPDAGSLGLTGLLAAATGFAAVVVGVLYTVGAVLVAGQLRPTGIPLRDALPFIPLPQLLARGMSAMLSSLAFLVIVFLYITASVVFALRLHRRSVEIAEDLDELRADVESDARLDEAERQTLLDQVDELDAGLSGREPGLRFTPRRIAWVVVVVIGSVLISDPASVTFFVAGQLAILGIAFGLLRPRMAIVASVVLTWAGALMSAYYYPQPLADVLVTTTNARIHGKLLAQTGDGVYVTTGKSQMKIVPPGEARAVAVHGEPRRRQPVMAVLIWRAVT